MSTVMTQFKWKIKTKKEGVQVVSATTQFNFLAPDDKLRLTHNIYNFPLNKNHFFRGFAF